MALFGSMKARRSGGFGAVPFAPSAEDKAAALPGDYLRSLLEPAAPAGPRGMFGAASGQWLLPPRQTLGQHGSLLQAALGLSRPDLPNPTGTPPYAPTAGERAMNDRSPVIGLGEVLQRALSPIDSAPSPVSGVTSDAPTRTHKPKFFGHGGLGWDIIGSLGDAFAAASGGQAIYWPQKLARQKHERDLLERAAELQRQRQADRDEWTWREDYRRAHPDDQFTSLMVAAGIDPRSPEGQRLYRQRAESMAAPPLMAVDGFDAQGNPQKTFMPRTSFSGSAGSGGPAVGTIRNGFRFMGGNPNDRASWQPISGGGGTQANVPFGR